MYELENGKLLVKGDMSDIFEVSIGNVTEDMLINVKLTPITHTKENGVEECEISFDPLNETLVQALQNENYILINLNQVEFIINSEC